MKERANCKMTEKGGAANRADERITASLPAVVGALIESRRLIEAGDTVLLGLSGGPDSLCLFDVLCGLREKLNFTLACVHVNHGLRGEAADADEAFVVSLCKERGIPCQVRRADCRAAARSRGLTEEEAGRTLRYEYFAQSAAALAEQGRARVRIAVAQNRNDQAETVLLRLLRGTGTDGLAGMDYCRTDENGNTIIRPLLVTDRADIEAYLAARGLCPRRDHTNEENEYVRNRVRNELLPYLAETFNPNIVETLARTARNAREDSDYLKELAREALQNAQMAAAERAPLQSGLALDLAAVRTAPPAVRHRLLRMAFEQIGLMQDIAAVHLAAMDRLIEEGRTSTETALPGGYTLQIGYESVRFVPPAAPGQPGSEGEPCGFARILTREALLKEISGPDGTDPIRGPDGTDPIGAPDGTVPAGDSDALIRGWLAAQNATGVENGFLVLDADKVDALLAKSGEAAAQIEFRTRRAGDRMPIKGGTKRLQDLMVDEKIPRGQRDRIVLAAAGSMVLWMTGGAARPRQAAGCAAGPGTKRFLVLALGDSAKLAPGDSSCLK